MENQAMTAKGEKPSALTMGSREIAEITGKEHRNVLRDCDRLNESYAKMALLKIEQGEYRADNGQAYREFRLARMQTLDLMTGYDMELRIKVNRRWEELERRDRLSLSDVLADPDLIIGLAARLRDERGQREAAERTVMEQRSEIAEQKAEIAEHAPRALFARAVESSKSSILVGELAKILRQNGMDTGQNRLFARLRAEGYLKARPGDGYNMPTQRAMEMGLFEIKETTIVHPDGHVTVSRTPKVTGRGQVYFVDRLLAV